ncbi:TPA: BspA family leucine-rich repeat surface protein [Campylobacter jejuni]|nr:BspA family leucine-rich repeat surface protein [Campylobacter jejuni]HDZ4996276.1 BspA family leucine-rich repeat surface protein [Campylobacter jejuni]
MQYILKNKDNNILKFEVENIETKSIVANTIETIQKLTKIEVIETKLLPKNLSIDDLERKLELWIKDRKAPKNRAFVENIVATYSINGKEQLMDYIDISLGLSLNDSFWIVPSDKDYKWEDYNLYTNEFDEALQRASFGEELLKVNGLTSSPEYTTNGMLKKCWHRDNGEIYLYKANSKEYANGGKEAYSEYYMAQVASLMNFEHIPYDLKEFHNQIVSSCPIFTNENEGYLPMYQVFENDNWKFAKRSELVDMIAQFYGVEKLQDLLVFDALIMNPDRHLGNFGMIIDNNTGELLREAPIFDNGYSFINFITLNELNNISEAKIEKISNFSYSFDEQLKLFIQPRHKEGLEKLKNFTFKRHEKYNLSEEWLKPIENFIRQRAEKALEFIKIERAVIPKYFPNNKEELQALIYNEAIYLGDIDTSKITDMSELFFDSTRTDFSGIEKWDVSKVKDMDSMFWGCEKFNANISGWNTSSVENMAFMFYNCTSFNQPLGDWDTGKVETMAGMFSGCHSFNQDLSSCDVSSVEDMEDMFENCPIDNSNKPSQEQSSVKRNKL